MSKHILVAVATAGCITRFRNGVQFTKTPQEIMVDDSELAILQADSYLSVDVLSHDAQNTGNGADDENATQDTALDTNNPTMDVSTTERITIAPDMASGDGTVVVDTAETQTDAGVGAATQNVVEANDTAGVDVSDKAVNNLSKVVGALGDALEADIVESMRGLNLDLNADKPTVRELKALGLDVSAKERDTAWDVLVAEHADK